MDHVLLNANQPTLTAPHAGEASDTKPAICIWLCGPLQIAWVDPDTGRLLPLAQEQLERKDATQALALLKLLLSRPGRQAHRDWIMEQFWPEHARSVATHRFHNITSAFRRLLSPPDGLPLLPPLSGRKDSDSLYRLPAYPRLWVDSDAILWNVEQAARMQRFGDDALPFWQRAYDLLKRGPYLPDEPYAAWAIARREQLAGCYRQCVHALSHLYQTRYADAGQDEALLVLQTYWRQHKTDEDALRPLMELLGKQERYQEAEECYQQLLQKLAELEDEDGEQCVPDVHTRDIREYLRTKQIGRKPATRYIGTPLPLSRSINAHPSDHFFSTGATQDLIDTIHELEKISGSNPSDVIYRRAILARLFRLPPATLATDRQGISAVTDAMKRQEEALSSLYEDMLIMGWDSFRRSKSPQIIIRIDEHVQKLDAFARSASIEESTHWKSLLCRFSQLSTRIAQHRLNESRALQMAKQAIMIAIDLDNAELIASTFYGRGRVYLEYSNTARDMVKKKHYFDRAKADVDAALGYVERVRPPLAGNIYLLAAEMYAMIAGNDMILRLQCEQWQEKVALLIEGEKIEDDGTFLKLNATALHHEKAKTLLRFGRIGEAGRELTLAWKTLQPNLFTWHMNMHLTEASLFLAQRDSEESAKSGLKAYTLARTIHSQKGEVEVQRLLGSLQQSGKANASVQELTLMIGNTR